MEITTCGLSDFDNLSVFLNVRDGDKRLDTLALISLIDLSLDHKAKIENILKEHIDGLGLYDTLKLLSK